MDSMNGYNGIESARMRHEEAMQDEFPRGESTINMSRPVNEGEENGEDDHGHGYRSGRRFRRDSVDRDSPIFSGLFTSCFWPHERCLTVSFVVTSVLHLGLHGAIIGVEYTGPADTSGFGDDEQIWQRCNLPFWRAVAAGSAQFLLTLIAWVGLLAGSSLTLLFTALLSVLCIAVAIPVTLLPLINTCGVANPIALPDSDLAKISAEAGAQLLLGSLPILFAFALPVSILDRRLKELRATDAGWRDPADRRYGDATHRRDHRHDGDSGYSRRASQGRESGREGRLAVNGVVGQDHSPQPVEISSVFKSLVATNDELQRVNAVLLNKLNVSGPSRVFEGSWAWLNGKLLGVGSCTWANGDRFMGEWLGHEPHGFGVTMYIDGSAYQGEYAHGKYVGLGKYTDATGVQHWSKWKGGLKEGWAVLINREGTPMASQRYSRGTFTGETSDPYAEQAKNILADVGAVVEKASGVSGKAKQYANQVNGGHVTPRATHVPSGLA